jgi:MFS family permease
MRDTARMFYGWWIVVACLLATLVGNALGLFGVGVYLHALIAANGWPMALLSGAVTMFQVVSALLLIPVGGFIRLHGPRLVVATGAAAMAFGVAGIGQARVPWQAYLAFLGMGVGWACLSTTMVASTLAPWFERYQGGAMSIASLGASAGGMLGAPVLLYGIAVLGFADATTLAAVLAMTVLLPLAGFVLRRRPEDMGLLPDGMLSRPHAARAMETLPWSRWEVLRTGKLRSVMVAFGIGMMAQIGFLTHQVTMLSGSFGVRDVGYTVSATALSALLGRLALARFADQIDVRIMAALVLSTAAGAYCALGLAPSPIVLVGGSIVIGLTVGNVTTLAPIIVRREFGAMSFGAVFGVASCGIQLAAALGPSLYGLLADAFGDYRNALLLAGILDAVAAAIILWGGGEPLRRPGMHAP